MDEAHPEPAHYETLAELEGEVRRRAKSIGARDDDLPTFDRQEDLARPNIEPAPSSPAGFAYVVVERGRELERATFLEQDALLYRVFRDVTFILACRHELAHRIADQDSRRVMFAAQLDLLSRLSPSWSERRRQELDSVLRQHPFNDAAARAREVSRQR